MFCISLNRNYKESSCSLPLQPYLVRGTTFDDHIDKLAIQQMMEETEGLSVTFHRAFDVCQSPSEALEDIISLGCHRLLTSGQASSAAEGIPMLKELVEQSAGRLILMPGAGVNPQNALHILNETGATEIHGSLRENGHTSADMVRAITKAME